MKVLIFSLIRWVYWYPFCRLIQSIPISLTYKLSSLFVPVYYFFSQAKRKKIFQGLVNMHGSMISRKQLEMIVYKTFDNEIKTAMEHLIYPQFGAEFCKKNIAYKGLENLDEALKAGRGVVLLHGHIGNRSLQNTGDLIPKIVGHLDVESLFYKEFYRNEIRDFKSDIDDWHKGKNSIISQGFGALCRNLSNLNMVNIL